MSDHPATLVLRFADLGVATHASLRVVGQPAKTVTWVIEEPILLTATDELAAAVPEPQSDESQAQAFERAFAGGPFATRERELTLAYILGVLLIAPQGWQLLMEHAASPRATLFVSPSARLAAVPWGLLAMPTSGPSTEELVRARVAAITASGTVAAQIPWQLADIASRTESHRLIEIVDVLMAVPPNIVHSPRAPASWHERSDQPALVILDPRVPGQRPDSALGSVLGRPSADTPLALHYDAQRLMHTVLPATASAVELFRRTDADRRWLADQLARSPGRMVYVGHASAADADGGHAERAALHLACTADCAGLADPVGDHRPFTAADLMALGLPIPPRVALLACASGGDYHFDEAGGLVAAMILGGAQLVTATLWSLPTTAGYRKFGPSATSAADPMADIVIAVDQAHQAETAGAEVNRWQREQMRRWRAGDLSASPVYWAALATFTVDGQR